VAKKTFGRGKRYSVAEKERILAAARRGNLTAAQVQERFGVSPLTFYRWRGPVRGMQGPAASSVGLSDLRQHVRSQVRVVLPGVIREEVNAYLNRILGNQRRRGRTHKGK
jgi:transposase-like protein